LISFDDKFDLLAFTQLLSWFVEGLRNILY